MKKAILIFFATIALTFAIEAQIVPFVEFQEPSYGLMEIRKEVNQGDSILFLINANDLTDIRTYVFIQKSAGVVLNPSIPSGWVIRWIEYEQATELLFQTSGLVKYINDNQGSTHIRIN